MVKTILAIGATGLGKTTMANILCDAVVDGSSGTESATNETRMYETDKFRYIDTRGFDCSRGTTDDEVFHNMMRYFQRHGENNIFNVDIILWFCSENERMTNHLQREANYIQRFIEYTDGYQKTDLWENVLIVIKGICLSKKVVDGPKSAARNACQATADSFFVKNFPCWIYDLNPEEEMCLVARNCYRRNEVKSKIQRLFPNSRPISIHFKRGKCLKCNEIGDSRLFTSRCHTTAIRNHVIDDSKLFKDGEPDPDIVKESKNRGATAGLAAGGLASVASAGLKVIHMFKSGARWVAKGPIGAGAGASAGTGGVVGVAVVGAIVLVAISIGGIVHYYESKNIRCKLCDKFPSGEEGCVDVCKQCNGRWNKTPGCELLSKHQFKLD